MGPHVILWGIGMALAAWLVHAAWWRLHRPKDDLKALAFCVAGLPAVFASLLCMAGLLTGMGFFLALLLAESLGAAYLFWYPAAQAVSPTMLITLLAGRAGPAGISRGDLEAAISEEALTRETIDNLFHEHFARQDPSGRISLDRRGRRFLLLVRLLRRGAGFAEPKG